MQPETLMIVALNTPPLLCVCGQRSSVVFGNNYYRPVWCKKELILLFLFVEIYLPVIAKGNLPSRFFFYFYKEAVCSRI
jgi:hypothetical protein